MPYVLVTLFAPMIEESEGGFSQVAEKVKEAWQNAESFQDRSLVVGTVLALATIIIGVGAKLLKNKIKFGAEERKIRRERQIEELKFKITGTEVERSQTD